MNKINKNEDATNTREQIPTNLMSFPDNQTKYDLLNQEAIIRIQRELLTYDNKLTEKQLWEVVAGTCSPEWRTAWDRFLDAEAQWKHLNSPKEISLGPIGHALDSHETDIARELYNASLIKFTFKNEELMQDAYIVDLLKTMREQTHILEQSEENTKTTQTTTNFLKDDTNSICDNFGKKNTSPLSSIFNKLQKWRLWTQKKEIPVRP